MTDEPIIIFAMEVMVLTELVFSSTIVVRNLRIYSDFWVSESLRLNWMCAIWISFPAIS